MKKMQTKVGKLKVGYWTLVSAVSALMFSVMPVLAADKNPNIDLQRAELALKRAMTRINVSGK